MRRNDNPDAGAMALAAFLAVLSFATLGGLLLFLAVEVV